MYLLLSWNGLLFYHQLLCLMLALCTIPGSRNLYSRWVHVVLVLNYSICHCMADCKTVRVQGWVVVAAGIIGRG